MFSKNHENLWGSFYAVRMLCLFYSFFTASPPTFVAMEEIMKAADGVTNMALAHEIVVDPDFRFNMPEKPDNR